jgi:hypothetical protein
MNRKWLLMTMVFSLVLNLTALENPGTAERKGGYAILDLYVQSFQEMAAKGARDILEPKLSTIMAAAVKAKEQGEIDQVFASRFSRLMAVTKLVIVPDQDKILAPVVEQEIRRFVKDVLGEDLPTGEKIGIGVVAESLAQEIINLQIYLDTKDQRQQMLKDFYKRFQGPEKKKD